MTLCLGRLPKAENSKAPMLRAMLNDKMHLIKPAISTNWRSKVTNWPLLGNDSVGDCVIAGSLHSYQCITANANIEVIPDTATAISDYTEVGAATNGAGYNPATGANDNGLVIDGAVEYWMKAGLKINANSSLTHLVGQARIDPVDVEMMQIAGTEFCGTLAGVNLPTTAQSEFNNGQPWTLTTAEAGSWGGHCIYLVDFDPDWIYAITWGRVQKLSYAWWAKYGDESVAILSLDWINSRTQTSPNNQVLAVLQQQIELLHGSLAA